MQMELYRPAPGLSQAAGPHALQFPWKTPPVLLAARLAMSLDTAHTGSTVQLPSFQELSSDLSHTWKQQQLIRSSVRPKSGTENANTPLEICRQFAMPCWQSIRTSEICSIHKLFIHSTMLMEEQTSSWMLFLCHQKGD